MHRALDHRNIPVGRLAGFVDETENEAFWETTKSMLQSSIGHTFHKDSTLERIKNVMESVGKKASGRSGVAHDEL